MARVNKPMWQKRTTDVVWFCEQLGRGYRVLPWPFRWALATLTAAGVAKIVGYSVAVDLAQRIADARNG